MLKIRETKKQTKTASINLFLALDVEEGFTIIRKLEDLKWVRNNKANFRFSLQPKGDFYFVVCESDHKDFTDENKQYKLTYTLLNSIVSSLK